MRKKSPNEGTLWKRNRVIETKKVFDKFFYHVQHYWSSMPSLQGKTLAEFNNWLDKQYNDYEVKSEAIRVPIIQRVLSVMLSELKKGNYCFYKIDLDPESGDELHHTLIAGSKLDHYFLHEQVSDISQIEWELISNELKESLVRFIPPRELRLFDYDRLYTVPKTLIEAIKNEN